MQFGQKAHNRTICLSQAMSKRDRPIDSGNSLPRDVKRPRIQQQTTEEPIEEIISSRHLQALLVFEQNIEHAVKGDVL